MNIQKIRKYHSMISSSDKEMMILGVAVLNKEFMKITGSAALYSEISFFLTLAKDVQIDMYLYVACRMAAKILSYLAYIEGQKQGRIIYENTKKDQANA